MAHVTPNSSSPVRLEGSPLSILLVDDDRPFVEMLAKEFTQVLGHHATVATSGEEMKKLLQQEAGRFHVVLLDYDMPETDGLEVLRWMRQHQISTPVVMLTGAGTEDVAVEAMKLGAYDYVRKEQLDLSHLDVLVRATHERHQFRIAKELEEERRRETGLTMETTERMREVVSAIAQTLKSAFEAISAAMGRGERYAVAKLNGVEREAVQGVLGELQRHVTLLESGLGGVLKLYNLMYAHHAGREEIQQIKQDFLDKAAALKREEGEAT
jgi:DNA-binding response OmpR family regulator